MKIFFGRIRYRGTVLKKDKIRVQNMIFAGKRKTQDEFYIGFKYFANFAIFPCAPCV